MPAPSDFLNKKFEKSGFSGYKMADVDSFMVDVASVISQQNREIKELKRRLDSSEKRVANFESEEESLKTTLLSAQRLADSIVRDANTKAELTLRDAQIKAERIADKAERDISGRKAEAENLRKEIIEFRNSIFKLYREHIELLNKIPVEDPEPAEVVPEEVQAGTAEAPSEQTLELAAAEAAPETETLPESGKLPEPAAEPEESGAAEAQGEQPSIRLNLRYNEKTGEYESIDQNKQGGNDKIKLKN